MSKLTAAVVTVTQGRDSLKRTLRSVKEQTYPCQHYVLFDNYPDHNIIFDKTILVCDWPTKIGTKEGAGQRWLAAAPHLINEDVTFFCHDDDWFEPDHVESIMAEIERGYDWAYSFRNVYDEDGNFVCQDNCEALGEFHPVWNGEDHHFVDLCMWGMKTDVLKQISSIFSMPTLMADRLFYRNARALFPLMVGTGKYTLNFTLGGACGVKKEFFELGNAHILQKFNGQLPWIET